MLKIAKWMDALHSFNGQALDLPLVLVSLDENH